MAKVTYQPLGPLLSGEASRAFLGLELSQSAPPRPVVLVWVPEEVVKDSQLAARVARETERASALVHPNVLKVHGLVALDEGLARVVEFADGEPLRRILDVVKKLPPRLAALVAADAAMGVHYAHVAGQEEGAPFLHGDIRPETLMVSFSGVCKVAGYGALGVAPKEPGGRRLPGRRWHCAPEQIVGGREALNRQSDVYLVGLVLYECLTGQIPFKDDPQFEDAVLNRPLPPLLPEDVPPPLIRVVEQATAKKAYDRYPTARALRDAIERAVGVLPAHEELAIFLRRFFPENAPARSARRREIESGIAELSRRSAEQVASGGATQAQAPASVSKSHSVRVLGAVLLVAFVLFGLWYAGQGKFSPLDLGAGTRSATEPAHLPAEEPPQPKSPSDRDPPPASAAAATSTPATSPAAETPTPRVRPAAETATLPESPAADARPSHPSAAAETSTPPATPAAEAPTVFAAAAAGPAPVAPAVARAPFLELTVEPPVDVRIDGRVVGRSPVSVAVAPGTHAVQLSDPSHGINLSRSIRVAPDRKTSQRLVIGKGTVEISAPDGAIIYIDGRSVGTAPLSAIPVYEGNHRILAKLGAAKWQQSFSLVANERMSFKIETVEQ